MQRVNRIAPAGPASAYQTYQIASPSDRTIRAACELVGCAAYMHGWDTAVDERTELGVQQAAYIRAQAGRTFRELRSAEGLTIFRFDSRQRCFGEHRSRPPRFSVHGGDWRQNLGILRQHSRPADWVEDFGMHQQTIQRERG